MIPLATGVAFLVSSLYGAGQASLGVPSAQAATTSAGTVIASTTADSEARFTDSKNIESYVKRQYADTPILIAIAKCESTFRQFDGNGNVIRGESNKEDVGVMQINEKYHADEAVKMGDNIYTVEGNVAFAKYLYGKFGAQPWIASSKCWDGSADVAMNK